ncbi:hypothetical protein BH10BDE1_BH10BDE1_08330 [soil metagenome]
MTHKNESSLKILLFLILATGTVVAYQNCSSAASFTASQNLNSLTDDTQPIVPNYATKTAGDSESFPPLKLLFVVDNSGTMEVNQINLATAFDRMFAGSNATNLAPFDTTAFVISTSQHSLNQNDASFVKLPTKTAEQFAAMSTADFQSHRGSYLDGLIPGDLVGFGLSTLTTADRTVTSYNAAPVALFKAGAGGANVVSRSSYKSRGGSVDAFSADFKERLALLNPAKSAVDPTSHRGVLDDVIDQESGLCGLARVLKNNAGILNPGDLASIVIVSDENDSDASGRACYDSIIEAKSGSNYIDGHCDAYQTKLSYRKAVVDPSKAKCQVAYDTGFSYRVDYKYPTTNVKYFTKSQKYDQLRTDVGYYTSSMKYDQLRTNVSYFTSKMTYDKIQTPVTYYTKSPTYATPTTNVKYYVEVESCTIRDGAKLNCTYTYPDRAITLNGNFNNQCATFVSGKLPSDALTSKAGYLPSCTAGTPVAKSGACSPLDTTILNCAQNYSSPMTVQLSGKVTSTCDAFSSGRLPAGALTSSTTDAGYTPACGNLITTTNQTGACTVSDTDKVNCQTVYTAASLPTILNGVPGTATCNDFAKTKLPAGAVYGNSTYPISCASAPSLASTGTCSTSDTNVANCETVYSAKLAKTVNGRVSTGTCESTFKSSLPAGTVLGNTTYPITCANGTSVAATGTCSTSDTNVANCVYVYSAQLSASLDGAYAANGCANFVSNRLGNGAVYTDANYVPTCEAGASKDKNVTGDQLYSAWPAFNPAVNGACSNEIRDSLVASNGLNVTAATTPTCTVTKINGTSQVLADSTKDLPCAIANWQNVCDASSNGRRNCAATEIAAGEKYEAATTNATLEGTFNCDTLCSKTGFCPEKSGTVGDNYYQCATTAAANIQKSSFTLAAETQTCSAGQIRVVTKGPYKTTGTAPAYVAADKSDANSPTALADMILERSRTIFNNALPLMSVFVRQSGDSLGTNGSLGTEYNRVADMFGGKKLSVLSTSDGYASALQDLSGKIRERLGQSVSFKEVGPTQAIRKVWLRTKGSADFTQVSTDLWSASGGTITLSTSLAFSYGDEFKIEYW